MRIEFEPISTLPALSWHARVKRCGAVLVRHGEYVEVRADRFVEGAWDGPFEEFEFDRAQTLAGSGGRGFGDRCIFATPFHPLEKLYVIQGPDETLVSNSFVFVLEETGDQLDPEYPNYFFDLVRGVRAGVASQPNKLRTRQGRHVELYAACRLSIDADLRLRCDPMPLAPPPSDFAAYFGLLYGAAAGVVQNAADSARKRVYTPVASCGRGYDSTASAALASRVGCKEGLTFARGGGDQGHPIVGSVRRLYPDSGEESLRALGMNVTVRDRLDFLKLPGHPKAEFFFRPAANTDASERIMEDKLEGSVFFSGRHGERYWGPTIRCRRRHFREVDDVNLSGHAYGEFRLRVGFVHMPAPYIGALHGPAIFRITHSEEMLPWKLGVGYYDRPIARRIAEEAGVPREYFGQKKFGSVDEARGLGPESERDFQEFFQSTVPDSIRNRLDPRPLNDRGRSHSRVKYFRTHYSHLPLVSDLMHWLGTDRMHRLWGSTYLYVFHWGYEKTRARYLLK